MALMAAQGHHCAAQAVTESIANHFQDVAAARAEQIGTGWQIDDASSTLDGSSYWQSVEAAFDSLQPPEIRIGRRGL